MDFIDIQRTSKVFGSGLLTTSPFFFATKNGRFATSQPITENNTNKSEKLCWLAIAKKAALSGGNVAYHYFNKSLEIQKKKVSSVYDNFTLADVETENKIRDIISVEFPEHQIIGEEGGSKGSSDYVWHIDPIDGTNNYIGRNSDWGVSVGLAYRKEPIIGAIYFPLSKSLYFAEKGKGAFKNGKRIKCSGTKSLEKSIICISSYFKGENNKEKIITHIKQIGGKCLGVRMYGCAIKNFAMLAEGQVSAAIKHKLWSWDACAGTVLVREAGGEVFSIDGKDWTTDKESVIAACTNELKKEILKLRI